MHEAGAPEGHPVLLVATTNAGKLREMAKLLDGLAVRLETLDRYPQVGEIPEEGETFEANALAKARTVMRLTGHPALAEDSGIEVDALGGEPGVRSARFVPGTDMDRNHELLRRLAGVPDVERTARYVSVVAVALADGREFTTRGTLEGRVGREMLGSGGFGYDPIFVLPEGRTTAQLTVDEKSLISHRGRALALARPLLEALFGQAGPAVKGLGGTLSEKSL